MSVRTMSDVWAGSQLSGSALLMLLAIADFSDDDGRAFPAVATLARKCRIQPRAANYLLRQIQDSGELSVRIGEGPKGCNLYKINIKVLQSSAGVQRIAGVQKAAGVQSVAGGAAISCANPLQRIADKPSLNHQEPPVQRKRAFPACPAAEIVDLYHQGLPDLPRVKLMGDTRKRAIGKFWAWIFTEPKTDGQPRARTAQEALEWMGGYFARAQLNDFIMGRTPRSAEHANWKAGLDYLLSEKGRTQVIEKTGEAA